MVGASIKLRGGGVAVAANGLVSLSRRGGLAPSKARSAGGGRGRTTCPTQQGGGGGGDAEAATVYHLWEIKRATCSQIGTESRNPIRRYSEKVAPAYRLPVKGLHLLHTFFYNRHSAWRLRWHSLWRRESISAAWNTVLIAPTFRLHHVNHISNNPFHNTYVLFTYNPPGRCRV